MARHRFPVTVYYEDTDMGGIVYHANYLKFIERARSTWIEDLGLDQLRLLREGRVFVVRHLAADFLAPARLGDQLTVETDVAEATAARWILRQTVLRTEARLFAARVTIACIDTAGTPVRLPAELRRIKITPT